MPASNGFNTTAPLFNTNVTEALLAKADGVVTVTVLSFTSVSTAKEFTPLTVTALVEIDEGTFVPTGNLTVIVPTFAVRAPEFPNANPIVY